MRFATTLILINCLCSSSCTTTQTLWTDYQTYPENRAFAMGSNGVSGAAWSAATVEEAMHLAKSYCISYGGISCEVIDVNGKPPQATPSGVRITREEPETTYGTCFAVSGSEVLTSHHVVANASVITVKFQDGAERKAIVSDQSQSTDLALLRISGNTPSFLALAPMRSLEVGEEVFTVGYPVTSILGADAKFTEGSVSALSGIQGDASYFQMSVPIQPGNSGGAVANVQGEVVGIVASTAAIEAFFSVSGSLPQNVNWASKADHARLMFDPPPAIRKAKDRKEAIDMVRSATCRVRADRSQ